MGKIINLKDYREKKNVYIEKVDNFMDEVDMEERIFFETNTECENFEEQWEM